MTKTVVLSSLEARLKHLIEFSHTVESRGSSDFDRIYFSGYSFALQ